MGNPSIEDDCHEKRNEKKFNEIENDEIWYVTEYKFCVIVWNIF
jgi:hypothetical protein